QAFRNQRLDVGRDALAHVAARPALALRPRPDGRLADADRAQVELVAGLIMPGQRNELAELVGAAERYLWPFVVEPFEISLDLTHQARLLAVQPGEALARQRAKLAYHRIFRLPWLGMRIACSICLIAGLRLEPCDFSLQRQLSLLKPPNHWVSRRRAPQRGFQVAM